MIWLSQWLCERRHCAIALGWDDTLETFQEVVAKGEGVFTSGALTDVPERLMNRTGYCCLPCEKDYVNFRRGFKAEHGRWPTVKEFKQEDDEL